ncbi:MAG: efflux RND transporter periplasmic adaptor subunit [Betaproteobacteria bacterium]|nr:MAG: efflux RND transporter periplasmic adaptor subunit [Betaproteobacteria bacterium]
MKYGILAALLATLLAAGAGYWFGSHSAAPALTPAAEAKPKPLYYRNPMGLPDTSPTPKKDPMGMDYIAVFEGEQDIESAAANQVKISTEKVQKLGVRTETARQQPLDRIVRAAGRIEPDERRTYAISPKFEGYIERLHVNVTGQPITKGQPLFEVYSPDLVSAQREYAIAMQGVASLKDAGAEPQAAMRQLAGSSLARLHHWDISEDQVKALSQSGEIKRTLTFRSPVTGIVTEKKALQGTRFMPGETLYQIADLSALWVIADVFEQDIGLVKLGAGATVKINAYPEKVFKGTVTYVYPRLATETRTVPIRIELANPGQLLKPGMFAQVELTVATTKPVITVPISAVIDSGIRRIVLVQIGEGRFEPREVRLGARNEHLVEVIEGVRSGEPVVVAANFLIDAESNLKAAIGGFTAAPAPSVSHRAEGRLEAVDIKTGTVSITHSPVASLKWPAMTMDFMLTHNALIGTLQPGAKITFSFVERKPGEWVITQIEAKAR